MNKPIAWMLTLPDGTHDWILDGNNCEGYIPLYTHPVKELTLTEDEIRKIYWNMEISIGKPEGVVAFARAILRKAQEK